MQLRNLLVAVIVMMILPACSTKVALFKGGATEPLQEFVVEGEGDDKVALVYLTGGITSQPDKGMFVSKPSPVQELVAGLALAEEDPAVKSVVLAIDSPGGTITASDILYHEIKAFKERSGKKVVVAMFDVAASGGYYAALPADWIMAHPTTITGSVGVIFVRPKLEGLMDKIGVSVEVAKSGEDKDMGAPYRPTTDHERELFQSLIQGYAARFHSLVEKHRDLTPENMELVKTARVFTADKALEIGLIDEIGYIQDVFAKARELSGLESATVVTYRRVFYPNDNPYNTMTQSGMGKLDLLGVDTSLIMPPKGGFYYAWPQGLAQ